MGPSCKGGGRGVDGVKHGHVRTPAQRELYFRETTLHRGPGFPFVPDRGQDLAVPVTGSGVLPLPYS